MNDMLLCRSPVPVSERVFLCRRSRRSCTLASAGITGVTAERRIWRPLTSTDCATTASGRPQGIPANPTTPRSSPCGNWPTYRRKPVRDAEMHQWCAPIGHICVCAQASSTLRRRFHQRKLTFLKTLYNN